MSEKFDPAPFDKHAAEPSKKDQPSDKVRGELEKGRRQLPGVRSAKQYFAEEDNA
jgi:hypothetical protein